MSKQKLKLVTQSPEKLQQHKERVKKRRGEPKQK